MLKESAVATLGEHSLLLPAWIKSALAANDRIKLYLSVIQAAVLHADRPEAAIIDLSQERAAAGVREEWIDEVAVSAARSGDVIFLPELPRLAQTLAADLRIMARPLIEGATRDLAKELKSAHGSIATRLDQWTAWLATLGSEHLSADAVTRLESGDRKAGDSVHILVMDMHKLINRLGATLTGDDIDGAHVWNIAAEDKDRIAAFMRGLHRTAPLKFDHPGLDTAATRDGDQLVIQNDIGTNDAHVLVVHVSAKHVTLTYSDLHRTRFRFFRELLSEIGATWSVVEPHVTPGLNAGTAYFVGTARFDCHDTAEIDQALEGLGARIVFLIDWNRARKRLRQFVDKDQAIAILADAARKEAGHIGWLRSGGERLVFSVMQSVGDGLFRLGDRLDDVLSESESREFLLHALVLSSHAQLERQPVTLVEDELRMLLTRQVRSRASEFDLVAEHAGYCQELAQAVRNALLRGFTGMAPEAGIDPADEQDGLVTRAKSWERRADDIVTQMRTALQRHPSRERFVRLVVLADDVADALEEAAFLVTLLNEHAGSPADRVRQAVLRLSDTVLGAVQDYVRALAIARTLGQPRADQHDLDDSSEFLDATWRVVLAEIRCDEELRAARRLILRDLKVPAELMLASDLALSLELASDRLMSVSYALRSIVLDRAEGAAH
jgi:uncharacterized protein Yka (UPF0111/DUF47 family)